MSNSSNPNSKMPQRSGGFFSDIANRFRLVGRLMADQRVSPVLKLLPVGTLVYLVMPDLIPFVVDDALVIWLGTTLFVELCPQPVVEEHQLALNGPLPGGSQTHSQAAPGDVIDGEFYETDPSRRHP